MEPSELSRQMAEMSERIKALQALGDEFVQTMRQIQDVMLFAGHPEVTALDDELDILYRGQL